MNALPLGRWAGRLRQKRKDDRGAPSRRGNGAQCWAEGLAGSGQTCPDAGVRCGDGQEWTPDPPRGTVEGRRGTSESAGVTWQQETGGAGIIQFEITETEMCWMPFAKMN